MNTKISDIIIENGKLRLIVGCNCIVKSLIYKPLNEECLMPGEDAALFSVTQERPFNNENKLIYTNKRTTYQANSLRREGDKLIAGFEITPYEAVVEIVEKPGYIGFSLIDFIVHPSDYPDIIIDLPPVEEFRLLQLPIRDRTHFGEWLNVSWDEDIGVNVLATSPYARIDAEKRRDYRIFSADAVKDIKLQECGAALIVSAADEMMDCIAEVEKDFDLPHGVESRRSPMINACIYWSGNINPSNVDEHIMYALKGGFPMMLISYASIFKEEYFSLCGNYDYREEYPAGKKDLENMINKIKSAGIIPGFHFLHTHIGIKSRYVTPVADHRLHIKRQFTLAKSVTEKDAVIYVEQNPQGAVMAEKCRILQFGGELISYEGYSTEKPYCFKGCVRGCLDTIVESHKAGDIGGILDVSEFGATSVYLDQNSDLQDEMADKIADIYNLGFEFVYFDGSEGTNAPFDFHIANAQYRVYRKFRKAPIFCEGAAKAHFGWHMLSGGNAFDIFPTNVFKQKITEFPVKDAKHMKKDFTRVNFGWWEFREDTQPDIFEFGMSRAAAWDCPATVKTELEVFKWNPRAEDILEVLRRWEDVRAKNWLTEEQKKDLKDSEQEHILLVNENGQYELVAYKYMEGAAQGNTDLRAFLFERCGKQYIACWHTTGSGRLKLPLKSDEMIYEKEIGGEKIPFEISDGAVIIPISDRHYISTSLEKDELIKAVKKAEIME